MSTADGACVRLAKEVRDGWGLLLAYTADTPFRMAPVRAQDWKTTPEGPGLVWGRVSDHIPLSGNTGRSGGQVVVLCELPHGASLVTAVGREVPVVVRPESPPLRPAP